jgi:hypothetical protein
MNTTNERMCTISFSTNLQTWHIGLARNINTKHQRNKAMESLSRGPPFFFFFFFTKTKTQSYSIKNILINTQDQANQKTIEKNIVLSFRWKAKRNGRERGTLSNAGQN